jgi:hypothetical protein
VVPQIHGLFQWLPLKSTGLGLLTIDETLTGRYLMAMENTVERYNIPATNTASATVGLLLRPITAWKGYNSLITTWYPPHISNFGLAATFDDGFNAPKFSRVKLCHNRRDDYVLIRRTYRESPLPSTGERCACTYLGSRWRPG